VPQEHETEFRTEELPLAAFLCLEGHKFIHVERIDGSPLRTIVFRNTPRLIEDVECFDSGLASVEPIAYQQKYYWIRNKMNPDGRRRRART
jgi:hypothetical protein